LGEEYFELRLKKQLKPEGVARLRECVKTQGLTNVVLVSQGLDHIMRPLGFHLGVGRLVSNRLEFREWIATGRLPRSVIRPRSPLGLGHGGRSANGIVPAARLLSNLGLTVRRGTRESRSARQAPGHREPSRSRRIRP